MMKRPHGGTFPVITVLVWLLPAAVFAAFPRQSTGVHTWTTASARILATIEYNPAALGRLRGVAATATYHQYFGIPLLSESNGTLAMAGEWGTFALRYRNFGNTTYAENTASIHWSRGIADEVNLGLGVHLYDLTIARYGSARALGIDAGLEWPLTTELQWELAFDNLNAPVLGNSEIPLPQQIYTAVRFQGAERWLTRVLLVHELRFPIRYGAGLGYSPFPWSDLAVEVLTDPVRLNVGADLNWSGFHVQYQLITHPALPLTHHVGILVVFGDS